MTNVIYAGSSKSIGYIEMKLYSDQRDQKSLGRDSALCNRSGKSDNNLLFCSPLKRTAPETCLRRRLGGWGPGMRPGWVREIGLKFAFFSFSKYFQTFLKFLENFLLFLAQHIFQIELFLAASGRARSGRSKNMLISGFRDIWAFCQAGFWAAPDFGQPGTTGHNPTQPNTRPGARPSARG